MIISDHKCKSQIELWSTRTKKNRLQGFFMADAYSKIKETILEKAESEITEFQTEAEKQAGKILKEAENEKERIIAEMEEENKSKAITEQKRNIATSALKWKMKTLEDKENYIQKIFDLAFEELKKVSTTQEYPRILSSLIIDGGVGMGGGDLEIKVRNTDISLISTGTLAQEISSKTGVPTQLKPITENITEYGGSIIQKGSIFIDNTFEAILERKKRDIRTEIAKTLFGE